jgi:hypothetical protein
MESVSQRVTPPGSSDRRHAMWIVTVVCAVVGLALLKPWGSPRAAPLVIEPVSSPSTVATASPTPDPDAQVDSFCLDPAGWRVYTTQRWGKRDFTSWTRVDPSTSATGPADRTIPVTPIVTSVLRSLGWCAPTQGDERPPAGATATIYGIGPDGGGLPTGFARLTVPRLAPDVDSPIGAAYGPPDRGGRGEPREGWPAGRYVIWVHDALGGSAFVRWFAVQVELVPAATP